MKSTFNKWLLFAVGIGATTLLLQSVNGRPTANAMVRASMGSAPQAIIMDNHEPIVESHIDLRRPRMAE